MTSKLTREQLLEIIETDHVQCGEASYLARMALTAMDSEPHTDDELSNLLWYSQEATCHSDPNYYCEFQRLATPRFIASIIRELQERRKAAMGQRAGALQPDMADAIYEAFIVVCECHPDGVSILRNARKYTDKIRHAQPAPVVPPMQHWEELCRQYPDMSIRDAIIRAAWWNHCRAAMLQAVPLTNEGDIALHNYRTALEGIGHIRRTLEETFGGLHGTHVEPDVLIECKTICDAIYAAYSGSSPVIPDGKSVTASTGIPVIPDGYVMVPKEPTQAMLAAFNDSDYGRKSLRERYVAMLAAAQHDAHALNSLQSVDSVAGKWIPVSERVPENDGAYLCWDKRYVTTYAFIFGAWQANQFIAKNITHWMPLPAAPQEVR